MIPERIKEIYEDFNNALERLKEALDEDLSKGTIVIDGSIQRFEFTFELAWKLAKAILDYNGIDARGPRLTIKEAFKFGLIKDGEGWIEMLEDRNKTSHIYDEKQALIIYNKIKENYYKLLEDFNSDIGKFINRIEGS
ncbi:MAG: nucleotidyltransferase substrate binding protein [Candidatus Omnitrophica bacterium]|nr:nucleotidyltransferase substrate binding protein [Candidatus Omnitrophota bacterium]MBU2437510.1 nucleotidyltransferase substrate binding protein [Candidatus Omnitrophota bacterium]